MRGKPKSTEGVGKYVCSALKNKFIKGKHGNITEMITTKGLKQDCKHR